MKISTLFGITVLLLAAATFPIATLTGCKSPTQQRQTFNTVWTLASTVDAGYRGYLDLVIARRITTNSLPKVTKAYVDFQFSLNTALRLASGNSNAMPTSDMLRAADTFMLEVNSTKKGNQK